MFFRCQLAGSLRRLYYQTRSVCSLKIVRLYRVNVSCVNHLQSEFEFQVLFFWNKVHFHSSQAYFTLTNAEFTRMFEVSELWRQRSSCLTLNSSRALPPSFESRVTRVCCSRCVYGKLCSVLSVQLASSLHPQEVRPGIAVTTVTGTLVSKDNRYTLEPLDLTGEPGTR